jgi:hypothetical protein
MTTTTTRREIMDILLVATTTGTGPFKPAVKWNNEMWVQEREFVSEDEAAEVAAKVVTVVGGAISNELTRETFRHVDT